MGPCPLAVGCAGDGGLRRPAGCQPRRIHADGNAGAAYSNHYFAPNADFYAAAYSNSDHRADANPAAYCDANADAIPNSNRNARTYAAARCAAGSHRDGHLHR